MLNTFTKGICAAAVAVTFTATAAKADNHMVMITEGGYLPEVIYVGRGDNLIFENETEVAHTLNGPEESWTSGAIAPNSTYVLNINNQMALTFSGESADGEIIVGTFTYDEAPLSD